MTRGQIFRSDLKELRNAVSGYSALKGYCTMTGVDTSAIHTMLQDQIKVFSQRVQEFGDNQTISSEWNSFVRFATIAGVA